MKKSIRKTLGHVSWALATAGTLGLTAGAMAQTSPYAGLPRPTPASQPVAVADTALAVAETNAHLAELKAELALMTEPTTFPCALEVHAAGVNLEISGVAPNETVRDQALSIVRKTGAMQPVDRMTIKPGPAAIQVEKSPDILYHDVMEALARELPDQAYSIRASAWARGQIMLSGTVHSFEDKVAASRCLQQVSGCSCVLNHLTVATMPAEGMMSTHSSDATTAPKPVALVPPRAESVRATPVPSMTNHPSDARSIEKSAPLESTTAALPVAKPKAEPITAVSAAPALHPYVATGMALLEVPEPLVEAKPVMPVPPPRPSTLAAPAPTMNPLTKTKLVGVQVQMQRSIAQACGKSMREVEVQALSDTKLVVRVKAHDNREAEQLSSKIFQLPELEPYEVSLDIPVSR
jgi:hypothetical protein